MFNKDWEFAQNAHYDKVAALQKQKNWETFCQDDEDDYDAERILCDIKNY